MTSPISNIPYGTCHCGCGETTSLVKNHDPKRNRLLGTPSRFVFGHQKRQRPGGTEAVPFKLRGDYCRVIHVCGDVYTIVNESDYEWLSQWKWHLKRNKDGTLYVVRKGLKGEGWRGQQIAMHRLILGLDPFNPLEGDHANGNCLDNTRLNLRPSTDKENARNTKMTRNSKSGFKGISVRPNGRFRVRITVNKVRLGLGEYQTLEEAIKVRIAAEKKYFGEFARCSQ